MPLPSDSPHGEDIKRIAREMLKEELSLGVYKEDGKLIIQMKLDGEVIGLSLAISLREV
jgi:hypothetical protein